MQTILREDYQLIKANYQEALSSKVQQTDAVMSSPDDHPLKLDTTTQTSSSTLEAELAELFVNNESELYALSESLIAQLEELIKVFYAYSRSESKIDQVEVELRESIASKEKELAVAKEAFTKQNQLNASFRERIQQLQG